MNNTIPPNTKSSDLHIIAASALAVAMVILGVAIAVHLGMLALGILVGVCVCFGSVAVMYHYEWPSSFIEVNKVEKVVFNEKKELVATFAY
ncbi:MAG: TomO hydrophobic C-terminal domain-containing protein [Wolbachia sp.]